jgi:hypothetical protein
VANPARGVALVVAAVLVGLFLLRNGLDSSATVTSTGTDQGTDSSVDGGSDSSGTDDAGTTTTTLGVRTPGETKTIVLNGSGVGGAAKRISNTLAGLGYDLTNPDGDNSTIKPTTTQVLYTDGFQAEAAGVAAALGAPADGVQALGTQTPGNTAGANVIVILAVDLANA